MSSRRKPRLSAEERDLEMALRLSMETPEMKAKRKAERKLEAKKAKKQKLDLQYLDDEERELLDTEKELISKVKDLSKLIKESKSICVFTGAGISTAAGIPDYRSKNGVWTQHKKSKSKSTQANYNWLTSRSQQVAKVWFPTLTHMALYELMHQNIIQFVISQNCDGLHLKSGIPMEKIVELHGNSFVERCNKCGKKFVRERIVEQPRLVGDKHEDEEGEEEEPAEEEEEEEKAAKEEKDDNEEEEDEEQNEEHRQTGKKCDECKVGELQHTIINFGEDLRNQDWEVAEKHAKQADLMIVFGSSLKVKPAMNLPTFAKKFVVCNLQETPLDEDAELVIRATSDKILQLLMGSENLNMKIPSYKLKLDLEISIQKEGGATASSPTSKSRSRKRTALSSNYTISVTRPGGNLDLFLASMDVCEMNAKFPKGEKLTKKNRFKIPAVIPFSSKTMSFDITTQQFAERFRDYQKVQVKDVEIPGTHKYQLEFSCEVPTTYQSTETSPTIATTETSAPETSPQKQLEPSWTVTKITEPLSDAKVEPSAESTSTAVSESTKKEE